MNKYHAMNNPPTKKPGLAARENQVAALEREVSQFRHEAGEAGPITGNVALKQQLRSARSGLKRQQAYADLSARFEATGAQATPQELQKLARRRRSS